MILSCPPRSERLATALPALYRNPRSYRPKIQILILISNFQKPSLGMQACNTIEIPCLQTLDKSWGQSDIPTSHFSERFLFRTVFIPKGFYSERSFLRTVFSPLIRNAYKLYKPKGHCSENFNSEMPFPELKNRSDQKPFGIKTVRNKNISDK